MRLATATIASLHCLLLLPGPVLRARGEAMRLGPPGADLGAWGQCRNRALNPLYALPHPSGSAYLMPLTTPVG